MNRLNIIQHLINKINAKSYLEIGIYDGYVFNNIVCDYKVGVDPDFSSKATVFLTSDDFFASNKENFDVIFIDGLHHNEQVYRDIENSLKVLNDNGYIICHDMNPNKEIIQRVPRETAEWTGDCWKAWVTIRSKRDDINMFVVDTDYGCGIINRGKQKLLEIKDELNWNNFILNRNEWLNLISLENFINL